MKKVYYLNCTSSTYANTILFLRLETVSEEGKDIWRYFPTFHWRNRWSQMPLKLRLRQVVKFKVDRYRVSELSAPGGVSTNNFALFGEGVKFPGFKLPKQTDVYNSWSLIKVALFSMQFKNLLCSWLKF